jgi:hypothetical protein
LWWSFSPGESRDDPESGTLVGEFRGDSLAVGTPVRLVKSLPGPNSPKKSANVPPRKSVHPSHMFIHLPTLLVLGLATTAVAQADESVQKAKPVTAARLWQLQIGGISG